MFSILLRRVISKCVTKTEESSLRPRIVFQRTIYTSNILPARIGQKSRAREWDLTELNQFSKDPDDLGKVVEFDLEELKKEDADNVPTRRKRRKKRETKTGLIDNLDIEKSKESDANTDKIKPKKFEDLRQKNTNSFSSLMTQIKSKKGREKLKQVSLEGKRLIHDAIKAGHKPLKVYFSRPSDLEKLNLPEGVEVFRIPYKKLQFWSDVVTSQGVIGIFQRPDLSTKNKKVINSIPLTVICDNIREPGNLGSILRVVASVGCEKLILTQGCVDIWEPKVLRSAAGAHFHLPVLRNISWNEIEEEITEEYKVILASCDSKMNERENGNNLKGLTEGESCVFRTSNKISESLPLKCYSSVDYGKQNNVIVIGGETFGLSNEAIQFAIKRKGLRVFIPMSNRIESLNSAVALGILSYNIRYQLELPVNSSQVGEEKSADLK